MDLRENWKYLVQSNLMIRNFSVILKLFLNPKCSLSLWNKLAICHRKWFLNTNLFLIIKFDCTWYIILVFVISMLSVLLAGTNSGNSSDFAICFLKRCQSVWQDRKTTNCAFRPKIRELQICCKQFVTLCAHRFQLACLLAQKLFRLADTYTGWTHVFGRFLIPTL